MGVGRESSVGMFLSELRVDDLPLRPSRARFGEDFVDAAEPCRNNGTPGVANAVEALARAACEWFGDGSGDAKLPWAPTSSAEGDRSAFTAGDSVPGILEELAEVRDAATRDWEDSWLLVFCGRCDRSNKGAGFFRRGNRKKVVVV